MLWFSEWILIVLGGGILVGVSGHSIYGVLKAASIVFVIRTIRNGKVLFCSNSVMEIMYSVDALVELF